MDIEEVGRVIDTADVLVIRFEMIEFRLLIDARVSDREGPFIAMVPKAGSVEERFKAVKRLRPRFPLPDKIMSFAWSHNLGTFHNAGLARRIEDRLVSQGGERMIESCRKAFEDLAREERAVVLAAIVGGEGYQTLWQRA